MTQSSHTEKFSSFLKRMQVEELPDIVIETFKYYYLQLLNGHSGYISEKDLAPVDNLPNVESIDTETKNIGKEAISKTVLIKLNGGLGTSMGLNKAKSLINIKEDLSFLDIIARQALHFDVPLVLMNSFATQKDSLARLKQYPELFENDINIDFVQHKIPKISQSDLQPVDWPDAPHLEWNPPGHGDIYAALITSGMLKKLLDSGYEYAFISNVDNLGAVLDSSILGHFVKQGLPFMMEVADRSEADKKGGHLALTKDGQLVLRETAQCHPEDMPFFQDINRYRYFNTNNLWINLHRLKKIMDEKNNILGLPLIRNMKTIDPRQSSSPPVFQLETALGTAISVFQGAQAIRVPRTRFSPVKTTTDLLLVRSDAYLLTEECSIVPNPELKGRYPIMSLDKRYYQLIDQFESRFSKGMPSILSCTKFSIKGDVVFGENVTLKGDVTLENSSCKQTKVESHSTLNSVKRWN